MKRIKPVWLLFALLSLWALSAYAEDGATGSTIRIVPQGRGQAEQGAFTEALSLGDIAFTTDNAKLTVEAFGTTEEIFSSLAAWEAPFAANEASPGEASPGEASPGEASPGEAFGYANEATPGEASPGEAVSQTYTAGPDERLYYVSGMLTRTDGRPVDIRNVHASFVFDEGSAFAGEVAGVYAEDISRRDCIAYTAFARVPEALLTSYKTCVVRFELYGSAFSVQLAREMVPVEQANPEPTEPTIIGYVRIRKEGTVNVREESNPYCRRVGIADPDTVYPCVGIAENGWYQIQLRDGTIGYVSNKMSTFRP